MSDIKEFVPIAELDVTRIPSSDVVIEAVVVLRWPFSSSTGSIAFLLAEKDFRLRRARGQVRWQLIGPSTACVASSKINIGDVVRINLAGSTWVDNPEGLKTPGQCIERTLESNRELNVQVC